MIAETSRKALTQTRSMLGLLRDEDTDPAAAPAQTIDDLDALVADVGQAGIEVALAIAGPRRPLDAGVELTAYRDRAGVADQRAQALGATHADVACDLPRQTASTSRSATTALGARPRR